MCNVTGIAFGQGVLSSVLVAGREVLEVGALDVNGSLRPYVESLDPARYVGVDMADGPRVDEVVDAMDLASHFGAEAFDVVITTEMLEHIREWRTVISNLKQVVRPGGILLITTRSIGFPYHGFPHDFWRYEPEDMRAIFADFEIEALERDTAAPGVFLLARKPGDFKEKRSQVALYSIVTGHRQSDVSDLDLVVFRLVRHPMAEVRPVLRRVGRDLRRAPKFVRRRVVSPIWQSLPASFRSSAKHLLGRD